MILHALPDTIAGTAMVGGCTHIQARDVNATPGNNGPITLSSIPGIMDGEDFVPSPILQRLPGIIPAESRDDFDAFCVDRGRPADVTTRLDLSDVLAYLNANDWFLS